MAMSMLPTAIEGVEPVSGVVRTRDADEAGLGAWAAQVTGVCPYLAPSVDSGQVEWTLQQAPAGAGSAEVEAVLFAAGLEAAERVRSRAAAGNRLACEVVAVHWRDSHARQQTILGWPHWALKHLTVPAGVMCGKFTPSAQPGGAVAASPVLALVLRAAVPARDHRFLATTPGLAHQEACGHDSGRPLLEAVPGITPGTDAAAMWPVVRAWAGTLPHTEQTEGATGHAA